MICHSCRRAAVQAVSRSSIRQLTTSTSASARFSAIQPLAQPRIAFSQALPGTTASTTRYSSTATPILPKTVPKPDYLDEAESQIWDLLSAEFAPTELSVKDISGGCGSMYGIDIASEKFREINMLKQQRLVMGVLGEQVKQWHGVQLKTKIPEEKDKTA